MKRRGFSLIELLVVIAIITIIVGLIAPAFTSLSRAQSLTTGAASVVDQLNLARQTALARNRVVEVRFYLRRENPDFPADPTANPEKFRSLRTIIYDGQVRSYSPLTAMQKLPSNVIVMDEREFSTLLFPFTDTAPAREWNEEQLPGGEGRVKYQYVRFKPGGGTDLHPNGTPDADRWFLTVKLGNDPPADSKPAHNYVTAMLDPVSGRVRTFRP